jgi:hypothetical protein
VHTFRDPMPLGLLRKLLDVRKGITTLTKGGTNEAQGYKYLQETQIVHMLKPLMDEAGIIFLFDTEKVATRVNIRNSQHIDEVIVTAYFVDADTGEYIKKKSVGFGADSGDKGIYKAITGAIKYIFMKTFLIPTGDDPENDSKESRAPKKKEDGKHHTVTEDDAFSQDIEL